MAGAGGMWLEQQPCNRLEQDTLAGGKGVSVWPEQEACGLRSRLLAWAEGVWLEQEACG